jgi:hypothetical protein
MIREKDRRISILGVCIMEADLHYHVELSCIIHLDEEGEGVKDKKLIGRRVDVSEDVINALENLCMNVGHNRELLCVRVLDGIEESGQATVEIPVAGCILCDLIHFCSQIHLWSQASLSSKSTVDTDRRGLTLIG